MALLLLCWKRIFLKVIFSANDVHWLDSGRLVSSMPSVKGAEEKTNPSNVHQLRSWITNLPSELIVATSLAYDFMVMGDDEVPLVRNLELNIGNSW